jgi:mRNA interferase MazF
VTRSEAVPVLSWLIIAPVTRTVRGIPTEIDLHAVAGLPEPCAANFDNLQPIRRGFLTARVGRLPDARAAICAALAALADC